MKKQVTQLKEFHKAFGLPLRNTPTIMPLNEFTLRYRILTEEINELLSGYNNNDLIEVTDAIIDSMYVLIGTAVQFGIADRLEQCFDEVHKSNMSKLDENGNPIMRSDGKVMKSSLYFPPDILGCLLLKKDNQ